MGTIADEPYVMPCFVKLLATDLDRSRTFYEALGFRMVQRDAVFVHLRWARYADLYLVATPPGLSVGPARGAGVLVCYSAVDRSLAELAEAARAQGAKVEGPSSTPWHTQELIVTDPDGYRLDFAQPR